MALPKEGTGYAPEGSHIKILHDLPQEPEPIDTWLDNHRPSPFTNEPSDLERDTIRYNLGMWRLEEARQRNRSFGYPTAKEPPHGAVSYRQPGNFVRYQLLRPTEQTESTEFDTMPPIHRTHIVPHNKQGGGRKTRKKRRRKRRKTHKKRRKTKRKKRRRKKKKSRRRRK